MNIAILIVHNCFNRSLKHRKYVYTSTEDMEDMVSSDCSKKGRKIRYKSKNILNQRIKASSIIHTTPKISHRRRTSFSFFNTLFDIVFWPYLFLKTNR